MPRRVDESARLQDIMRAVLRIAAHDGLDSVTFRTVAAALGASTTVVTHFVPDRESLLERAFQHLRAELDAAITQALAAPDARSRLRALVASGLPEEGDVVPWLAYGRFILQGDRPEWAATAAEDHARFRSALAAELGTVSLPVPLEVAVDLCVTVADGISTSVLVDGARWSTERQYAAVEGLLDALGV